MVAKLFGLAAGILALSGLANAHGSHSSDQAPSNDWATRHMMGRLPHISVGSCEANDSIYRGTPYRIL